MARDDKTQSIEALTSEAQDATATTGAGALRFGQQAAQSKFQRARAQHVLALAGLCGQAADHLADARGALFDETQDADSAIGHLDAALSCLKQLGEVRLEETEAKPKPASNIA